MLTSMGDLALTYGNLGRWKEAEQLEVQVLETTKRVLGEEHPDTLRIMNNLAYTLKSQGQDEKAISLMKNAVDLLIKQLGPTHPNTISAINTLNTWQK